jgi:hypothetical protein
MINIPLSFSGMWLIMLLGVLTHILVKINKINHDTPSDISQDVVIMKFFKKEWASYGMSIIFTGIIAYSFYFIKRFDNSTNEEISRLAKFVPLAVLFFYGIGVLNQWIFYFLLGRISKKSGVDIDLLENPPHKP